MKKSFIIILFPTLAFLLFGNSSCKKTSTVNIYDTIVVRDTVYVPAPFTEINVSSDTSNWDLIQYSGGFPGPNSISFPAYGAGRFEITPEGIKGYCQTARITYGLVTTKTYDFKNHNIYLKWKSNGASQFSTVHIHLSKNGIMLPDNYFSNTPSRLNYYMTNLSSPSSYNGSTIIQDNVWYYTRISISETQYSTKTCTGNYDDQGGTLVESKVGPLLLSTIGTIGIYDLDPYAGTSCYKVVGEFKIK